MSHHGKLETRFRVFVCASSDILKQMGRVRGWAQQGNFSLVGTITSEYACPRVNIHMSVKPQYGGVHIIYDFVQILQRMPGPSN